MMVLATLRSTKTKFDSSLTRNTVAFCLLFFAGLTLFSTSTSAKAKKPEWVTNYGRSASYPETQFLIGFGASSGIGTETKEIAQDNARADLSRSIIVNVESQLSTLKKDEGLDFSQKLSSLTQSSTSLQGIIGLNTEIFIDREDKKNPTTYALAYARRSALNRIYMQKRTQLRNQIRTTVALAESNEKELALKYYLQSRPFFEELKKVETILAVSGRMGSISSAFGELEGEDSLLSLTAVNHRIDQLALNQISDISHVAGSAVFQLNQQTDNTKQPVMVVPFTYQDTGMSSQFSRYLQRHLETQMDNTVNQNPQFRAASKQVMRDLVLAAGAECLLAGSYWEKGNQILVLATLRDIKTGKSLASVRVEFPLGILPENISIKPQNFAAAMIQQQAFAEGEIVSSQLQVEVWTNRGSENVLFNSGEEMRVYVRVNRQSYVRLLYILADGAKTLLFDGLYIDQSKVNQVVEVPEVFECASPFGAEMMIAVARTKLFDPLATVEVGGYFFLQSTNSQVTADLTRGTKGFKRKKKEGSEIQQSESRLVITTMSN